MTDYAFGPLPVVDPSTTGGVLVPGAQFQFFAFTDTTWTAPLTVTVYIAGVPASVTTLTSSPQGILDEFVVVDQWQVWAKSGDHVVLLQSVKGLAEAAAAAAGEAAVARSAAEDAAAAAAAAIVPSNEAIDARIVTKADLDPETGKVVAAQLPDGVGMADATAAAKGAVRLSGDLGGTADAPTVPGLLTKANDNAVLKLTGAQTVAGQKTFTSVPVVPDGSFTPAKLAASGTPDSTSYLRGDGQWATPPGAVVYGTTAGTAAQGNDARITGAAQKSANLSDMASASTARSNLGALPVTPAPNVGADYSITYAAASALGSRPTLPAGAVLRIWGGTTVDADPTWMIDGDYRDIPVVG